MEILLCTQSEIKTEAVKQFFNHDNITCISCDDHGLPPQPLNCEQYCAKERINYCKKKMFPREYDMIISIENGIRYDTEDCCTVLIESDGIIVSGSESVSISSGLYTDSEEKEYTCSLNKYRCIVGYDVTVGEKMVQLNKTKNPKNWMLDVHGVDRKDMIFRALKSAYFKLPLSLDRTSKILKSYKEYHDFPKPGVLFQDIFAVLSDSNMINNLEYLLKERYNNEVFDYVVGLESRGFFGILLSRVTNTGFIPVRKAGKLPGNTEAIEYGTEYSKDKMEISKDIPRNSRVIIFDDLIATGGSLKASIDLLEKLDCHVVDCCVLTEVSGLRKIAKQKLERPYTVLLRNN